MTSKSLSVLIPTRDCMALLPGHVRTMVPWLDLAEEIIVVDSESSDGTVEFLRKELSGYPVRFHAHPRGLYQSWNEGIGRAQGKWLYISTVGDSITRELLLHLHQVATAGECDVVLGCPEFLDENDQALPCLDWAVIEIASTLASEGPCVVSGAAALFYALRHLYTSALLGSCASNLYRTAHLKKYPFPTDYGIAGDAAWSLLHAFKTRFGCTAHPGSTFRLHAKAYDASEYHIDSLEHKLWRTGIATHGERAHLDEVKSLRIPEMLSLVNNFVGLSARLKHLRQASRSPWYLHGDIWQARSAFHQNRRALDALVASSAELIRERHRVQLQLNPVFNRSAHRGAQKAFERTNAQPSPVTP